MWSSFTLLFSVALCSCCLYVVVAGPPRGKNHGTQNPQVKAVIRSLHITSDIKYRYATTVITTKVINPYDQPGEATFSVTLPESAFISQFLMEVDGKVRTAHVEEKKEAETTYGNAVSAGQSAGHVLKSRDSNLFTMSLNIEAHGQAKFNLTYEQLLPRSLGWYSNIININPNQIVEDMSVLVNIEELTAIAALEVPELQVSNEVVPNKQNKYARIVEKNQNHKQVMWALTPDEQKSINAAGVSGQFIVKYDVQREGDSQQILVDEGYFVHFFAPDNLPKIRNHAVFVLDFSWSMKGKKLNQLREAMKQILTDLSPKDYFSIVVFESWAEVWSPTGTYITSRKSYQNSLILDSRFLVEATPTNIHLAHSYLKKYSRLGTTNMMGGLRTGLELVDIGENQWENESNPPQPLLVFLTDGDPNVDKRYSDDPNNVTVIMSTTKSLNTKQCPIFSLAFGYGADFNYLRKLSLQNYGFARQIYEGADAAQQLKNFYQTIGSPLLSNVTFTYVPGQVDVSSNTKQEFPVFFKGSELVVAGRVKTENLDEDTAIGELRGITSTGAKTYPITKHRTLQKQKERSIGHLEKVWSYLTIRQLLDKTDSLENEKDKKQTRREALDLALQYGFVTPLTSLVVVKPDGTELSTGTTKVKPGPQEKLPPSQSPRADPTLDIDMRFGGFEPSPTQPIQQNDNIVTGSETFVFPSEDSTEELDTVSQSRQSSTPQKASLGDIKWLQNALNSTDPNQSVTVEGIHYKLGLTENNLAFGECKVNSVSGECRYFPHCALDVFKDNISQFLPYKCDIPGNFLGVCCPKQLIV